MGNWEITKRIVGASENLGGDSYALKTVVASSSTALEGNNFTVNELFKDVTDNTKQNILLGNPNGNDKIINVVFSVENKGECEIYSYADPIVTVVGDQLEIWNRLVSPDAPLSTAVSFANGTYDLTGIPVRTKQYLVGATQGGQGGNVAGSTASFQSVIMPGQALLIEVLNTSGTNNTFSVRANFVETSL